MLLHFIVKFLQIGVVGLQELSELLGQEDEGYFSAVVEKVSQTADSLIDNFETVAA
jgi:hypothetical protein